MSQIEYKCIEGHPDPDVIEWITRINQEIFALDESLETMTKFFEAHRNVLICAAFKDGHPVGFKIGFEENPICFESWRGGVVELFRRQGIADELMLMQHHWCEKRHFQVIKTVTNGDNAGMLILNLRHGFEVVGSAVNRRKNLKVFQEKWLSNRC